MNYADGEFSFKSGGKKFMVPEKMIDKISWAATGAQLDAAFENEPALDILQAHSKNLWMCAEPVAGFLFMLDNGNRGMLNGVEVYAGAAYGIQQKSGKGTGRDGSMRGFEYILPAQYMLNLTYGSMSGDVSYTEPGATGDSTTALSSSTVMLMLSGFYRHSLPIPSLYFYWGAGLGVTFNFDSLESYPMGWKEYEGYPDWMITPDLVDAAKFSGMYLGEALRLLAGLQLEINDLFFINAAGGYIGRSKQRYDNPFKYYAEFTQFDARASLISGGWYFEASAKFLF